MKHKKYGGVCRKHPHKSTRGQWMLLLMAFNIGISGILIAEYVTNHRPLVEAVYASDVSVPKKAVEKEKPMQEWILDQVAKAGLNTYEAAVIIQGESSWIDCKDTTIPPFNINTNGTIDVGIWRINSIHMNERAKKEGRYISLADACDYKKATEWAIRKRLHDGNWSAWVAAKRAGIK